MLRHVFIDTETTGTTVGVHQIIQIAGIARTESNIDFEFSHSVKPINAEDDSIYSAEALEVNGIKKEDILTFTPAKLVHRNLITSLSSIINRYDKYDKAFFVAYNAHFDWEFMYDFFAQNGDKFFGSWFWFPPLDVCGLAQLVLQKERHRLPNFKLMTVARYFGITIDESKLHDAMYDIQLTMELFDFLTKIISVSDWKGEMQKELLKND